MSSKFFRISVFAASIFIGACNGSETKTVTETDKMKSDSAMPAVSNEPAPTPSTIITTPLGMMIAKHRVTNFEKWKASYDAHDSLRLANGMHTYVIGRGAADPNMVLVSVTVDDMAKAKAFAKDPSLKLAMQKGGVTGTPMIDFFTVMFRDTGAIRTTLRSETVITVKDWTAWQTAFETGKQERMDNGIMIRAYGHDADNNNKVRIVAAITDSAKAMAYWKSDMLKAKMAASGVIGEPKRFLFNVVQRY